MNTDCSIARMLGAIALAGLFAFGPIATAQPPAKPQNKQRPRPQEDSAPATYPKILDALDLAVNRRSPAPLKTILARIERYGVDFSWSEVDDLQKHGAPANVLEIVSAAVTRKFGPRPAPSQPSPPPAPPAGQLWLRCAPVECDIEIAGKKIGVTERGAFRRGGFEPGTVTVLFTKEGYLSEPLPVKITAEPTEAVSVTLKLDPKQKAVFGERLRQAMLRAIGAGKLRDFSTVGNITSVADGKTTEWSLKSVTFEPPAAATFVAGNLEGSINYACAGEICDLAAQKKSGPRGKPLKGPAANALIAALKQYVRYHFASIVERLATPGLISAEAADLDGKKEQAFRLELRDEWYEVTLGADLLPSLVVIGNKAGVNSGLKVSFGDYARFGSVQYPKRTTIGFPGGAGIDVRLEPPKPAPDAK